MLAAQVTSTECANAERPVPVRGTESTVLPLLVRVRLPFTVPAAPGLNTTGTLTLCPAFRLMGVVTPTLNPEPAIVSCVIETAALPVFVIFTVRVAAEFRTCDPKPRLLGVAVRVAEEAVVVGMGVGLGEVELAVFLTPQPIALKVKIIRTRKRLICTVGFILLRTVTPHFRDLNYRRSSRSMKVRYHFIISNVHASTEK